MPISSAFSFMLLLLPAAAATDVNFTFSGTGQVPAAKVFKIALSGTAIAVEDGANPSIDSTCVKMQPRDCSDILACNSPAKDGIYTITPSIGTGSIDVYCDMTNNGGGWTVLQRRNDGSENFFRNWADYKTGFGSLRDEFWLGNDNIYRISNQRDYSIRIDLEDFIKGKKYALFDQFYIDSEIGQYKLHISSFSGDAGDALSNLNGMAFSTKDQDNDVYSGHCAQRFLGAWWYSDCHSSNLNGEYNNTAHGKGVNWSPITTHHRSLKRTVMKIRP